jgi:sulfotransferase family protein
MRLPEFLIGGAPRSGTTWLYWLLDRHPDAYMARPLKPEPKFFLVDHLYAKGIEHYSRTWFADAPVGKVAGEKSTDYLESSAAADRIALDLPAVKLIFILREPVERAWSNYLWTRMNGLETEDFETAVGLEEERERNYPERLRFARPHSYVSRGMYADLLRPYFARFAREQILVVKFEDIIDAPRDLAVAIHDFLGIAPRPNDADGIGVINPSEKLDDDVLPNPVRAQLARRYEEPNRQLAALLESTFQMWT